MDRMKRDAVELAIWVLLISGVALVLIFLATA